MTQEQTLVGESGHPLGLFRSKPEAPRVMITNSMMVGMFDNQDREAISRKEPLSIAYHENIVDLLEYAEKKKIHIELLSDQTSCHEPYLVDDKILENITHTAIKANILQVRSVPYCAIHL